MMARILILDLNPKLTYPDLSIAYLVTPLRAAGLQVVVETFVAEEKKQNPSQTNLNLTNIPKYLESTQPALILIPSYLNHYVAIQKLAHCVADLGLPLILGGGCLTTCSTEDLPLWLSLKGVTAVFVGEADWVIAELVATVLGKQDLSVWPGVCQRGLEMETLSAPPLQELELLPLPDLSDFAWQLHRSALIPILTSRTTRLENKQNIYSSRPVQAVLSELYIQAKRYPCKEFIFLDPSLNANLAMWYGLIDNIQAVVPGCRWLATIFLDGKNDLGLDLNTFVAARTAGLRHLNISLDATQTLKQGKLLNTAMERNRELVAYAYQAGLSVRCLVQNHTLFNSLADLPNTNDFLLQKLVETTQARQTASSAAKQTSSDKPTTAPHHQPKQTPTLRTDQTVIKSGGIKSDSLKTKVSFWQRLKKTLVSQKSHKTSEANQLV
ncbi:hypothetical protein [uncultured Thiothrix sp.]|uniref:hypothetical protein n=1 Tax=uncultured Thiothrix sp. TaxID=223185 RepID=UPI00262AB383|nr:hypothetical protein [uncultured Thiothrix sp.]HMT92434.1 hypothetical protein [Thiolinea sp.]